MIAVVGLGVAEGVDMPVGLDLPRTDGDEERVVLDASSLVGVNDVRVGVDPRQRILGPVGVAVARNAPQRVAARRPEGERLAHRHRAVHQLLVRGDQLDVHRIAGKLP